MPEYVVCAKTLAVFKRNMHVALLCIARMGLLNNSIGCAPSVSLHMHVYVMQYDE